MGLGTSSNIGRHKEQRWQLRQSPKFERQPGAWAGLVDKVRLLHETTLSRLGEMVVLSNAYKSTQRVKENEERKECVPNNRTR